MMSLPDPTDVQKYNDDLMARPLFNDSYLQSIVLTTLNLQAQEELVSNSDETAYINNIVDGLMENPEEKKTFLAAFEEDGYIFQILPPVHQELIRKLRSERTAASSKERIQRGGDYGDYVLLKFFVAIFLSLFLGGLVGGISHRIFGQEEMTLTSASTAFGTAVGEGTVGLGAGALGGAGSGLTKMLSNIPRIWYGETTEQSSAAIEYAESLVAPERKGIGLLFTEGDPSVGQLETDEYNYQTYLTNTKDQRSKLIHHALATIDSFKLTYKPQIDTLMEQTDYSTQEINTRMLLLESQRAVLVSIVQGSTGYSPKTDSLRTPPLPPSTSPAIQKLVNWMDSDFTASLEIDKDVESLLRSRGYTNKDILTKHHELFDAQKRHEQTYQRTLSLLMHVRSCFEHGTVDNCPPRAILAGLCHLLVQKADNDTNRSQALQLCGLHPRVEESSEELNKYVEREAPFLYLASALPSDKEELVITAEGDVSVPPAEPEAPTATPSSSSSPSSSSLPSSSSSSSSSVPSSSSSSYSPSSSSASDLTTFASVRPYASTGYGTPKAISIASSSSTTPSPMFSSIAFAPTPLQVVVQPVPPSASAAPTSPPQILGEALKTPTAQSTLIPIPVTNITLAPMLEEGVPVLDEYVRSIHTNTVVASLVEMWNATFPRVTGSSSAADAESTSIISELVEILGLDPLISQLNATHATKLERLVNRTMVYHNEIVAKVGDTLRKTTKREDNPIAYERTIRFYGLFARMKMVFRPDLARDVYDKILADTEGKLMAHEDAFAKVLAISNTAEARYPGTEPSDDSYAIFRGMFRIINFIYLGYVEPEEWNTVTWVLFGGATITSLRFLMSMLEKITPPSQRQRLVDTLAGQPLAGITNEAPPVQRRKKARAGSTGPTRPALTATAGGESTALVSATGQSAALATATGTPTSLPLPRLTDGTRAPGVVTYYTGGGGGYYAPNPPIPYGQTQHSAFGLSPPPLMPPANTITHYGGNSSASSAGGRVRAGARVGHVGFRNEEQLIKHIKERLRHEDYFIKGRLTETKYEVLEDAYKVLLNDVDKASFDYFNAWLKSQGIHFTSSAASHPRKRTYKRKNARVLTRKRRVA